MIQITICRPGKTGILRRKCNNNATNFQEIQQTVMYLRKTKYDRMIRSCRKNHPGRIVIISKSLEFLQSL